MSERSVLCESPEEELFNAISHAIGAFLSVVGLVLMVKLAAPLSGWHVGSVAVFGSSLILLYSASTVYHLVTTHRLKRIFQVLDHALIFVLIAGSYTPWLLVNLRGPWGWSLFFVVWGIALAGMVLKAFFLPRFDKLGTALYVVMGWIVCIAIKPLIESVGPVGMAWLVAGGLCYTGGVAFYLMKRRFAHFTWHLFVMAGSICHVIAVITGVIGDQ
ncbi:MAG: hemolysin III family protein [Verrucomicrobiales bacterium]|jgi:hemolysin III|nr:hemolysin III family protein [Verrucomicrobiales bacterium]